ncbi:glutamate racemase [uncultured Thiothrix sp.]|uniref:glutamate racemase n=1 Tax=uncultured Thiothrix sp. TaxID=223185 RepID=UPI0026180B77|nr:glutamate racemase [uncultured Thiothrix sp.]
MTMSKDAQPIGVFDSGLGGISVLREIHRLLPQEELIYIADSGHAPYGSKSSAYITQRCLQLSEFLLEQGAKMLVVACNTATAHAIDRMREQLNVPVIGIEPAVKPAARMTQTGVIGVLATQQTVKSQRLQRLIEEYASGVKVVAQGCPGLVEHVERGDFASKELKALLTEYTQPLIEQGSDVLVLGCTHYPFLASTLREMIGCDITLLETSNAVAQHVMRLLDKYDLKAHDTQQGSVSFYSSKPDLSHWQSMQLLWQHNLTKAMLPEPYLTIPLQKLAQDQQ